MTVTSANSINYDGAGTTYPSSIRSEWFTTNVNAKTANASDTNPTLAASDIFDLPKYGVSAAVVRLRYATTISSAFTTDAQIMVIGRTNGGEWSKLPNRDGDDGVATKITLTSDVTNDLVVGTGFKATDIDASKHWFDTLGSDQIAVVIVTAANVGLQPGNLSIEAKFL